MRLILSRSLAHPQGKILGAAVSTLFRSPSFTQSVIFSGSPSRKRLQRYRLFPFMQLLLHTFLQSFFRFLLNSLIYFMLYSIFFITIRKRMWNVLHYIIRAGAHVCAKNAGKVSRKTEKNSRKAWNCARNTEKGTEFLHGRKGTFYVSVTKNLRFRNAKRTVRMAETYVLPKENIKTMETLHGFLPEVF